VKGVTDLIQSNSAPRTHVMQRIDAHQCAATACEAVFCGSEFLENLWRSSSKVAAFCAATFF
jgi:hypothetical protein